MIRPSNLFLCFFIMPRRRNLRSAFVYSVLVVVAEVVAYVCPKIIIVLYMYKYHLVLSTVD